MTIPYLSFFGLVLSISSIHGVLGQIFSIMNYGVLLSSLFFFHSQPAGISMKNSSSLGLHEGNVVLLISNIVIWWLIEPTLFLVMPTYIAPPFSFFFHFPSFVFVHLKILVGMWVFVCVFSISRIYINIAWLCKGDIYYIYLVAFMRIL